MTDAHEASGRRDVVERFLSHSDFVRAHIAAFEALTQDDVAALLLAIPDRARSAFLSSLGNRKGVSGTEVAAWVLGRVHRGDDAHRASAERKLLQGIRRRLEQVLANLESDDLDVQVALNCLDEFGLGAVRVGCTHLGVSGRDVSKLIAVLGVVPGFILEGEEFRPLADAIQHYGSSELSGADEVGDGVDIEGLIRDASDALDEARQASDRIQEDLFGGLAPMLGDVAVLGTAWARVNALALHGGSEGISDSADSRRFASIVEMARATQTQTTPERQPAERLLTVEGPPNLAAPLESLREKCRSALLVGDEGDNAWIEFLVNLIDLASADADNDGSFEQLDELSRRTRALLPTDAGPVVIAAVQGKLRIAPAAEIADMPVADDDELRPQVSIEHVPPPGPDKSAVSVVDAAEPANLEEQVKPDSTTANASIAAVAMAEVPEEHKQEVGPPATVIPVQPTDPSADVEDMNGAHDLPGEPVTGYLAVPVSIGALDHEAVTNLSPMSVDAVGDRSGKSGKSGLHQPEAERESTNDDAPDLDLLLRLLYGRKWSLAHYWAAAYGLDGPAAAYAAAAYSEASTSSDGACAGSFSEVTTGLTLEELQGHRGATLAAVAAAVRASLIAPLANGPAVIGSLRPSFTGLTSFNALLDAVVNSAVRGVDITALASTAASIAAADERVARIVMEAGEKAKAAPTRTLKFSRATRVWQAWTAADGMLGQLLSIVAGDQRANLQTAKSQVIQLRGRGALDAAMDHADNQLRNGPHREAIEAGARTRLLDWANDILHLVSDWCNAANEQLSAGQAESWQQEPLLELRAAVREHSPHVHDELLAWATEDELVRAHVAATFPLLDATWKMCDGQIQSNIEPPASEVLTAELLGVGAVRFDATTGHPLGAVSGTDIESAIAAQDPDQWYAMRADEYDHVGTGLVIDYVRRVDAESADRLAIDRDRRIDLARSTLDDLRTATLDLLAQARRQGYVDEDRWAELAAAIEANQPTERLDLDVVRSELDTVREAISQAREGAITAFESELSIKAAQDPRVDREMGRIKHLISIGDLATAQEALLLASDRGESLPEFVPESTLEAFRVAMEKAGADSVFDSRVVVAARDGKSWGRFDFGLLDAATRGEVADSFSDWLRLSELDRTSWMDLLPGILRLAGIEITKAHRGPKAGSTDRVWLDLEGVVRTGRALVPAFGSASGNRLRVLVCRKSTPIKVLEEWLKQDGAASAVLVLRPGVTTARDRRELFDHFRSPQRQRTVGLIDDAVIAWLGSKGGRHFDDLMKVVLPWAAHNPYTPHALGRVPVEMFYGRNQAVASVVSPTGTVFIYGGRQLGKSALLRAAARRFEEANKQVAIYVDLYSENIGRTRPANAIWETLWKSSTAAGIVEGKAPVRNTFDSYRDAVLAWLRRDERHRLLLLLDEADRFLDADAENGFSTTAQIKGLMEDSDRRCKVVLAGLHTVQRFVGLPNEPLTNIANPMSIGPMEPKAAFDLVTRPLEALGYRFSEIDLANRILAYCNFYPSLIQLFADALVTRMLESPLAPSAPPQVVTAEDIEAVYASAELSDAFRHRLNLTLGLDEHYQAITYSVALMALTGRVDAAIPVGSLRERCREFWLAGFGSMSADQFRHLCDELVGLGVLARVGIDGTPGYRLRSPNVLRMLGTEDMVMDRLTSVSGRPAPTGFPASTARANLADGSSSPLTAAQTAELLAPRTQVLIVVGSPSGGIDLVPEALREAAGTGVEIQTLDRSSRLRVTPSTDGRHRVLLQRSSTSSRGLRDTVAEATVALRRVPKGTTVAFIVVVDQESNSSLIELFSDADAAGRVVEVGLLDFSAVKLLASERSLPFTEDSDVSTLLAETGGIRSAVEAVATKYSSVRNRVKALTAATDLVATPEAAATFIATSGIEGDLADAFSIAMQLDTPHTIEELTSFVREFSELAEPAGAVRALLGIGALQRLADGRVRVPSLLAKAWLSCGK